MDDSIASVPEVRRLVAIAKKYVNGECHFLELLAVTVAVEMWANRSNSHPAIRAMASEWSQWIGQAWNEWGLNDNPMPESELRQRIAEDLGGL